ncbi:MAG: glycosyltransferase family 4 protein [Chloroflexota bacterium]
MSQSRPRTLLVISAQIAGPTANPLSPRRDYHVLRERLDAEILSIGDIPSSRVATALCRIVGAPAALAWLSFSRRSQYDVVLTDGEQVGLLFALLLKIARSKLIHLTIGHRITATKKRLFFRWLGVQTHIDRIAVHASRQVELGISELGITPERLSLVPYQVDTEFWKPQGAQTESLICSAGLEFRDYPTLFAAVDGVDAQVVVGAASYFSRRANSAQDTALPANVRVGAFNYEELRALYDRAAVVVVPLDDVDFQAGVTTILEAMAMAKPVIVTHTSGQTDVVIDRRSLTRGSPHSTRPASLLHSLAEQAGWTVEPTGLYVAPGDVTSLRSAIEYLLANPDERHRLGQAGRELVERFCTVEQFADRFARLIDDARLACHQRAHAVGGSPMVEAVPR